MKRIDRISKTPRSIEIQLRMTERSYQFEPEDSYDFSSNRASRVDGNIFVAIMYFLHEDLANMRRYLQASIPANEEYLLGDWRNQKVDEHGNIDPEYWIRIREWMEYYDYALLSGSVLGDWDHIRRVSSYPRQNACLSDGQKPQRRDQMIAVASYFKGDPQRVYQPLLDKASEGPVKRCVLFLAAFQSILQKDAVKAQHAFDAYLKYYLKTFFPKDLLTELVTMEGTFLYHFGKKNGVNLVIAPQYLDHIIVL